MSASLQAVAAQDARATPSALAGDDALARAQRIEQSHLRCAALGLTRVERPDFEPLVRGDLVVARERNRRLFTHAAPVMEMLFEQIVNTGSMIVLTDAQGTILHSIGDAHFLARAGQVALAPGVNWAEPSKGTNAIGTALVEGLPTLVHGGEHFIHANSFLTCSAAPIVDPRGNMLGVLDVTGDQHTYHQHTMGLVRMSARMIENHWLSDDCGDRLRLHFHPRPEFIGTLLEGIVVVGGDGRLLGANRSALDLLDLGSAALRRHTLASLFGTSLAAVADHFRAPLPSPMRLMAASGRQFHVGARFSGPIRSMMAGFDVDIDAAASEGGGRMSASASPSAVRIAARSSQAGAPAQTLVHADVVARVGADASMGLDDLCTGDPQVAALVHKVRRVLDKDIPLLLLGETGTGKELLARAVHQESARARRPFVAVNCASIPESLIEAELFGYEDGAFTGARRKGAVGRIVQADGGTLFLDEIGDMPLALQARLLRVLQERCVTPLGSHKSIAVDIAVVSATHRSLREMIAARQFRADLYYRLNGLAVRLPALRDRVDLDAIVRRLLTAGSLHAFRVPLVLGVEARALFGRYAWPGNIRQLANVLRTAAAMAEGEAEITPVHLSDDFLEEAGAAVARVIDDAAVPGSGDVSTPRPVPTLGESRRALIEAALAACDGNVSAASKRLGVSRNTLYRRLRAGA